MDYKVEELLANLTDKEYKALLERVEEKRRVVYIKEAKNLLYRLAVLQQQHNINFTHNDSWIDLDFVEVDED